MTRWLLPAGLVMAALAIFLATRGEDVRAAGPCGTTHDAVDAEEQQFLSLLHSWRVSTGVSSEPMEQSGALNMAAAWFAEYQVTSGLFGGHGDNAGRIWVQRAIDCGYTAKLTNGVTYWASASGEGIHGSSVGGTSVGPQQALAGMIGQGVGHSGIYMNNTPNFPAKCYGVAVSRSGTKVAWVVVIAALPANLPCPGGSGGGTPPTVPSSATAMPPTATPTKTPTPTPSTFRSWFSQLSRD